jgi:glycosyltransferase involved in cell wall biosynthesis
MRAAALVPAFNEASSISQVVRGLRQSLSRVFVVDDGSSDRTAEEAREAGATVIALASNTGKGSAIRAGLEHVLKEEFTHIVLLDGDMQHLPQEASRLLDAARLTGADLVVGERQFSKDRMPPSRYYANRAGSAVLSWFVGASVTDTQCGFRVFRTDALRRLRLTACGYEIETEMLIKVRRRSGLVASVPVTAVYTGQISKLRPIRDTTRTCFLAVYYRFLERS